MAHPDAGSLYEAHSRIVFCYLLRLSGDRQLAEELAQETFYQAFLSLDTFRGECKASTWLCQIAKNLWLQYLRKKKHAFPPVDTSQDAGQGAGPDPLAEYIAREEESACCAALQTLPEEARRVVLLRTGEALGFAQIGARLGKSEAWARTTYFRAKKRLREHMKKEERG